MAPGRPTACPAALTLIGGFDAALALAILDRRVEPGEQGLHLGLLVLRLRHEDPLGCAPARPGLATGNGSVSSLSGAAKLARSTLDRGGAFG